MNKQETALIDKVIGGAAIAGFVIEFILWLNTAWDVLESVAYGLIVDITGFLFCLLPFVMLILMALIFYFVCHSDEI
jgi:hypothetical protein